MRDMSWGTFTLLFTVDALLVVVASAMIGWAVADATKSRRRYGLLVGVLLPVLGPVGWAVVATARNPGLAALRRGKDSPITRLILTGTVVPAVALMCWSWLIPWGSAEAQIRGADVALEQRGSDHLLSSVFVLGSVAATLVALVVASVWSGHRRSAIVLASVAAMWLLVTVDAWVLIGAADGLGAAVSFWSQSEIAASLVVGPAVFMGMGAGVLLLGAAVVLLALPNGGASPDVVAVKEAPSRPAQPAESGFNYEDSSW